MANIDFGEYSAFMTPGGIRFQHNKKMVSRKAVPPEVVAFLSNKLGVKDEPKFPMPTEEEKAKLRAESLQVPPELQRTDEQMAENRQHIEVSEQLTDADFDVPPVTEEEIEAVASSAEVPTAPEVPNATLEPDFLEKVSIHTASLEDIAQALYDRFGIYTAYLGRLPVADEVNPLTTEPFSKYHLGIAYQAAIRVQSQGLLSKDPEIYKKGIEAGRDAHANFKVDEPPRTMGDARQANSFAYRTSVTSQRREPNTEIIHEKGADGKVHAVKREIPEGEIGSFNGASQRFSAQDEEILVEPQFGKKVIRPDW
ncbi:hypothetical protein KC963_00880 [Candidatus Saccharibacteria bacterium]|nr:hypothetical protein [Candidatus Saccharibacteria bacterium]